MEKQPASKNIIEQEAKYFEFYEVKEGDLEALQQGIDTLAESKLIEEGILDDIRFVTYDSKYFYVFTNGRHAANEKFAVEEIPSSSKTGFKIFKIMHSGFVGKIKEDYRGARAWLLCDEIETTSVNAKKFPNENVLYEPDLPQPKEILDVISMAPIEPYNRIQQGRYNYLTDVIFHEAGHIEHRRLKNWQEGQEPSEEFHSEEQKEKFLSIIRQTKIFPAWITNLIIENVGKYAINEMYPMLIDREGAKRYDIQKFYNENIEFQKILADIRDKSKNQEVVERLKKLLKSGHTTGRLLVRVLEEQFPDFSDRKKFVRSVLERTPKNKDIVQQ